MSLSVAYRRDLILDKQEKFTLEIPAKLEQLSKKDDEFEATLKDFFQEYLQLLDVINQDHDSMGKLQTQIVEIKDLLVTTGIAKVVVEE